MSRYSRHYNLVTTRNVYMIGCNQMNPLLHLLHISYIYDSNFCSRKIVHCTRPISGIKLLILYDHGRYRGGYSRLTFERIIIYRKAIEQHISELPTRLSCVLIRFLFSLKKVTEVRINYINREI